MKESADSRSLEASLGRFCRALAIPTVSGPQEDPAVQAKLKAFQDFLVETFPAFHAQAEAHRLSPFGDWYRLPASHAASRSRGDDSPAGGSALKPVLFLAHYDVVPVEESRWTWPPFGGMQVATGEEEFVVGRGALDTKNTLMSLLEGLESLCASRLPRHRDIYVALGGDEELDGQRGAREMAGEFRRLGLSFSFVHDEGGIVALGIMKGVSRPLALVGVAEKGFCNIRLRVPQAPGHASRPPARQAAATLGLALHTLGKGVFRRRMIPSVRGFLKSLARELGGLRGRVLKAPALFDPLVLRVLAGSPETAAMIQTTLAMTRLEGSKANNVLPHKVQAILNLRILPGETVESCLGGVRKALRKWPEIQVDLDPDSLPFEAVGEAPLDHEGWELVSQAARDTFAGSLAVPYLNTARTDSGFYAGLAGGVYRFAPMALDKASLDLIHGDDERISVDNYLLGLQFYRVLLEKVSAARYTGNDERTT